MAAGGVTKLVCELVAPETARPTSGSDTRSHPLRSSLAAVVAGSAYPDFHNPLVVDAVDHLRRSGLEGMTSAMLLATVLGNTGAGSDLDALDVGPAHLALPATAAVVALGAATDIVGDPVSSVNFGCTVGARLRVAMDGAKPGLGFHSVSSFGIVAAASAAGHALGLDEDRIDLALRIALDRAAGFAANNNSTDVGISHFGWAAAHGLEAAWLAREGMSTAVDLEAALTAVFGGQTSDLATDLAAVDAAERTVYKTYPVNIYLNSLYERLSAEKSGRPGAVRVTIPNIPRLAIEHPQSPRELRNSVRGVAALALAGERAYRTFSSEWIEQNRLMIEECVGRVDVELDPTRSTSLISASIEIAISGDAGQQVSEVEVSRPGRWDHGQLVALLATESDAIDAALLRCTVYGSVADAIRDVVGWIVRVPTN